MERGIIKKTEYDYYEVWVSSCWGTKTFLKNVSTLPAARELLREQQIYKAQTILVE